MDVARLEEHVLLPVIHGCAAAGDSILRSSVLFFSTSLHGDEGIDRVTIMIQDRKISSNRTIYQIQKPALIKHIRFNLRYKYNKHYLLASGFKVFATHYIDL